ncbi:MAG: undecaprenyl-diphosphate phosphatase [Treponema sp.]|nr:undecaprenyl-diphosphate phosphatase [Candidatus Treponema equifaecale]
MSVLQSVLLGILQGVAEFLPISSSGHLTVAQALFGLDEVPVLFDVMLHLATLAAVVIYFRKKIARLFQTLFRWIARKPQPEAQIDSTDLLSGTDELGKKTIIAVILATFVTAALGILTSKLIPELPIQFTCMGFLVTAGFLIFSSLYEKKQSSTESQNKGISVLQALFVGFMQGIGTLPGISRSGSTIAGAQLAKINRTAAGEFSFIISIPAILGAFVLEAKDLGEVSSSIGAIPVIAGCIAAFIAGYFSLACLMKLIKKGRLEFFAFYLVPLGIAGLIYFSNFS